MTPPTRFFDNHRARIVVTGGPGAGKTTAADFFRREIGERIVVVPESATMLFAGGFPRSPEPHAARSAQAAIYQVQRHIEDVQAFRFPQRILLCDRGTLDGAAYWPGEPDEFFEAMETSWETELKRYDSVIFFESAAAGGLMIEGGNPTRVESIRQAAELDHRLRALWERHPGFVFIPHRASFFAKITAGLQALQAAVDRLEPRPPAAS